MTVLALRQERDRRPEVKMHGGAVNESRVQEASKDCLWQPAVSSPREAEEQNSESLVSGRG